MYKAEIHGKIPTDIENKEDILTSNVFSFFKYSDRKLFLFPYLKQLKFDISIKDAQEANFEFWPVYEDNTEPDLVIRVGDYYLLFEAKYLSGFGQESENIKHQLVREYQGGMDEAKRLGKKFELIAITADPFFKLNMFEDVPQKIAKAIKWTNWQCITHLIENILSSNNDIPLETMAFAADLKELLIKKGLRSFQGFKGLTFYSKNLKIEDYVFFNNENIKYIDLFAGFKDICSNQDIRISGSNNIFYREVDG